MSEHLNLAIDNATGVANLSKDTLLRIVSLVGTKRRVLCISASTLPVAHELVSQLNCEVTILSDPNDFISIEPRPGITLIIDKIDSPEVTKRFKPNEFDVIILADALNQIKEHSKVLTNLLTYFSSALVISIPQLNEEKQALIQVQSQEIDRLKQLLRIKEESISWYSKRMREHLVNHYKLEKTAKERIEYETRTSSKIHELSETLKRKEHEYHLLFQDRERIINEVKRLNRFSPDRLPKLIRYPLKASILAVTSGPSELIRIIKKKRAFNH